MPTRPPHPCNRCRRALTTARYCDSCKTMVHQQDAERRGTAAERGYDHEWLKVRARHLAKHPQCEPHRREGVRCFPMGKNRVVHHKIPHRGNRRLRLDPANLETSCKPMHDQVVNEGDFGRSRVPA